MSWDCTAVNANTLEPITFEVKHELRGGTYSVNGTDEAWLNITYNYGDIFRKAMMGMTPSHFDGVPVTYTTEYIRDAISNLGDDYSLDYWEATEGNAKKALEDLLVIAEAALDVDPDCIWQIA